jgi:hypothetical protein
MNHDYEDHDNLLHQLDKDSLPGGWEGGTVRHTGGGIWCREFHHPERELRVIYSMHQPGVGLEAVSKTDEGQWVFDEHLDDVDSPNTNIEKFKTALQFMEKANNDGYES